jgi:hypothetical protein
MADPSAGSVAERNHLRHLTGKAPMAKRADAATRNSHTNPYEAFPGKQDKRAANERSTGQIPALRENAFHSSDQHPWRWDSGDFCYSTTRVPGTIAVAVSCPVN